MRVHVPIACPGRGSSVFPVMYALLGQESSPLLGLAQEFCFGLVFEIGVLPCCYRLLSNSAYFPQNWEFR